MYARLIKPVIAGYRGREIVFSTTAAHERVIVFRSSLEASRMVRAPGDGGIEIHVPDARFESGPKRLGFHLRREERPLVLGNAPARRMLGRAMARVNESGSGDRILRYATELLDRAGAPDALLLSVAGQGLGLHGGQPRGPGDRERSWTVFTTAGRERLPNPVVTLALEMALNDETERCALEGELAELEAMWREAEEIAAIADALPDGVPEPASPRLDPTG
jgi:PAS domain-containing protein